MVDAGCDDEKGGRGRLQYKKLWLILGGTGCGWWWKLW